MFLQLAHTKLSHRYFEIARGSLIEIDAALDIAYQLTYTSLEQLQKLGDAIINTFKLLLTTPSNNG